MHTQHLFSSEHLVVNRVKGEALYGPLQLQTMLWPTNKITCFTMCMSMKSNSKARSLLPNCIHIILTHAYLLGFDQLCWHNIRITGTYLSGISIKHYSRIIGFVAQCVGDIKVYSISAH